MAPRPVTHSGSRVPADVVGQAVWTRHVPGLGPRGVEPVLAEMGFLVVRGRIQR